MQLHNSMFRLTLIAMAGLSHSVYAQQTEYLAMFDPTDTWVPYADASYTYDSNLFRTPTALIGPQPTSDTSWRKEAGLTVDEVFSSEHLTAKFDVNKTTFNRFSVIDYQGKDAMANLGWVITDELTGALGTSYSQSLTPYTQFHLAQANLRSQKNDFLNEAWLATPNWQLHSNLSKSSLQYDLASQQYADNFIRDVDFGVDYLSDAQNKIGVTIRRERGTYPNEQIIGSSSINNNYTQNQLLGDASYAFNGMTSLELTGGWLRRAHDYFSVRDVSGPTIQLNLNYVPTGKLSMSFSAWRSINSTDALTVSYTVNKGLSYGAVWNAAPRIQVAASLRQESLDYTGASVLTALLPQDRIDIMRSESLNLTYTPLQQIQASLAVYGTQLSSNTSFIAFRDQGASLNVRLSF